MSDQTMAPAALEDGGASLWSDAWVELRHNPLFLISTMLIVMIAVMALVPGSSRTRIPTTAICPKTFWGGHVPGTHSDSIFWAVTITPE